MAYPWTSSPEAGATIDASSRKSMLRDIIHMAYAWSSDLETGNQTIDAQHKELIRALNDLLDACAKGKGCDSLKQTADFLYSYTSQHFAEEEQLQLASGYADYEHHKKEHEDFKQTVYDIAAELDAQGPSDALVSKVNTKIGSWLLEHIKKEDVKVAAHLRAST